ncbi:MAG: type II secretion system F family protein [Alphaproteobacteria bacterium]|nr:type II secretion system F family protein [Alphaproteobacteria bacterium]MDX5369847.1 type II secretion system F family protein [Alphaproteobacteria bacterium]MDX5464463.1 type II secretion system F family protein [Alphaproteobacteria bacterium]
MGWIDTLLNPEFVVTVLTAIAAFATIVSVALPYFERDTAQQRIKAVAARRDELRARQREELNRKNVGLRAKDPRGVIKRIVEDLNLRELLEGKNTRIKLTQAGLRGQGPLFTFLFFQLVMPIILFVGGLIYFFTIDKSDYDPMMRIGFSVLCAVVGYYLPTIWLQNMIQKRQEKIRRAFPDALDLLLICVESGMSIEAAFNKVAEEITESSIELAEEMGLTNAELAYLGDRRQALENLAIRTGLDGVKAVTTALTQAERYGTPLGQALRVLAQENRDERMALAEKKAAALPAKLTVPMIVFFLPVLFVVILGPAILKVMAL